MRRSWPKLKDSESLVICSPKITAFLNAFVTGIFFVFSTICLVLGMKLVRDQGITGMIVFGFLLLVFFWFLMGFFFVKNLKIVLGKAKVTLVANNEGLFLDIITKMDQAFFIPWSQIDDFSIRKVTDPFWHNSGLRTKSDTLSISFTENMGQSLPKVVKNVAFANRREINLHATLIDLELEEAVAKLKEIKAKNS